MIVSRDADSTTYECAECRTVWTALTTDISGAVCPKVRERLEQKRIKESHSLLFPEWMTWDERYWSLAPEYQMVWRNTRGVYGDFENEWKAELKRAESARLITFDERLAARRRYKKWLRMQSNDSKNSTTK